MKDTLKAPCVVDVGIGISAYWKSLTNVALDTPLRSSTTILGDEKWKSILHWVKCTARSRICASSKDWRNRTLLSILLADFQLTPDLTWITLAGKSSQCSRSCVMRWEKAPLKFILSLGSEVKVRGRLFPLLETSTQLFFLVDLRLSGPPFSLRSSLISGISTMALGSKVSKLSPALHPHSRSKESTCSFVTVTR